MKKVGIIMGSDSDLPIVQKAIDTLKAFNVPYEVHIFSAHRTPGEAAKFAQNAQSNGFGVLIAAAGMAAHLAGCMGYFDSCVFCFRNRRRLAEKSADSQSFKCSRLPLLAAV